MAIRQIEGLVQSLTSPPGCNGMAAPGADMRPAHLALRDGLSQCLSGQIVLAVETFQHAYIMLRKAGDRRAAALTQKAIGLCLEAISTPEVARDAYNRAIRLLQNAEMGDEAARLHLAMARFEAGHGVKREAINALHAALVIYREIVNPVGQVQALCQYAELELAGGQHNEAHDHARQALVLVEQIDDVNTHEKLRERADALLVA